MPLFEFVPKGPDAAGIVSWIHIGDLHMTVAGEQNHADLLSIVKEINSVYADSLSFVYLPGDIAEHGNADAYAIARNALEPLNVPWCSIVGDHDVHQKSFEDYLAGMLPSRYYAFDIEHTRFLALNAFDIPHPQSFCMLPEQLDWVELQLEDAKSKGLSVILLLHCYPSDLKQGADRLRTLVNRPLVRLIDMGHTHYNELANDGRTLYTATRSTGQIEEGPVGYSITNFDHAVVSWKFVPLGKLPVVVITSPSDERFITDPTLPGQTSTETVMVRVKAWSTHAIQNVRANLQDQTIELSNLPGSQVWQGQFQTEEMHDGIHILSVVAVDAEGNTSQDSIRCLLGASAYQQPKYAERDQDNAIAAWPERGLLGTQLGPNKNGRKW